MSNIDKIRQEIKRRHNYENEMYHKKKPDGRSNDGWAESLAIMGVLEELLTFLDTLSEEPDKSLEEAAEDFVWEVMENDEDGISDLRRKLYPTSKINDFYDALAEFFKAGAKRIEKEINKELIKAMEKVHEIRDVDYDIHVDTSANGSFETISYYENGKLVGQDRSKQEE